MRETCHSGKAQDANASAAAILAEGATTAQPRLWTLLDTWVEGLKRTFCEQKKIFSKSMGSATEELAWPAYWLKPAGSAHTRSPCTASTPVPPVKLFRVIQDIIQGFIAGSPMGGYMGTI